MRGARERKKRRKKEKEKTHLFRSNNLTFNLLFEPIGLCFFEIFFFFFLNKQLLLESREIIFLLFSDFGARFDLKRKKIKKKKKRKKKRKRKKTIC